MKGPRKGTACSSFFLFCGLWAHYCVTAPWSVQKSTVPWFVPCPASQIPLKRFFTEVQNCGFLRALGGLRCAQLFLFFRIGNFQDAHWASLGALSTSNTFFGNFCYWIFNHHTKRTSITAFTTVGAHLKVNNKNSKLVTTNCSLRASFCTSTTLDTSDRPSNHALNTTLVSNSLFFSNLKEGKSREFLLIENL